MIWEFRLAALRSGRPVWHFLLTGIISAPLAAGAICALAWALEFAFGVRVQP